MLVKGTEIEWFELLNIYSWLIFGQEKRYMQTPMLDSQRLGPKEPTEDQSHVHQLCLTFYAMRMINVSNT